MHFAVLVLTITVGVIGASAGIIGLPKDHYAHPAYKTSYSVEDKITGDKKSASEVRDGDITKGSYSVLQPDGVLRIVNYVVSGKGGFQAQVINKGLSVHPVFFGISKGHELFRPHGKKKILRKKVGRKDVAVLAGPVVGIAPGVVG